MNKKYLIIFALSLLIILFPPNISIAMDPGAMDDGEGFPVGLDLIDCTGGGTAFMSAGLAVAGSIIMGTTLTIVYINTHFNKAENAQVAAVKNNMKIENMEMKCLGQ